MKHLLCVAAAFLSIGTEITMYAQPASAAVVQFSGSPSSSFTDGAFSSSLSGDYADGFYAYRNAQTAYNGYGQNGEYIRFANPVTLESLQVDGGVSSDPTTITVSLLDSANQLISSQTDTNPSGSVDTLTFDASNVEEVLFTFTGGYNAYGDGRTAAWYQVSNVTYSANIPEPASIALLGFAVLNVGFIRRRRSPQR